MEEFNTVSVFSVIDERNFGFLDFENIKNFLFKFKQEIIWDHERGNYLQGNSLNIHQCMHCAHVVLHTVLFTVLHTEFSWEAL